MVGKRVLLAAAMVMLVVPSAGAGTLFVGASLGQMTIEDDGAGFEESDNSWKITVGWQFLKFFAIEGAYLDGARTEGPYAATAATIAVDGFDVFAVGILPIARLDIFGKAGIVFWDSRTQVNGFDTVSASDESFAYGIGLAYRFTDRFDLRAEWENFDMEAVGDVNYISLGFDVRF